MRLRITARNDLTGDVRIGGRWFEDSDAALEWAEEVADRRAEQQQFYRDEDSDEEDIYGF